ncbi:MAG TPA: NUDIX domain-containing protein [Kaistiaceae bacterium]|nr:NUDIX domain-containing protein [Kaistiaceae bacterium]
MTGTGSFRDPGVHAPRLGASVVLWRGGTVLLVKRGKEPLVGHWSLPGGHVEPGEPLEAAARRELFEETRLVAEALTFAEFHEIIRHDATGRLLRHFVVAVFAGMLDAGEPIAGDDAADAAFFDLERLDGLEMTPGTRDVVGRSRALLAAG